MLKYRIKRIYSLITCIATFCLVISTTNGARVVFAKTVSDSWIRPVATETFISQTSPSLAVPLNSAKISFKEIASNLASPVYITHAGDGSGRIFIVERTGYIRIVKNGALQSTPFLDIHTLLKIGNSEQGLLALAFHPAYSMNGTFFIAYTAPRNGDSTGSNLILEKFSVSNNNPDTADPASGTVLLTVDHPTNVNHNGGTLAFGADGYLYWSIGDGGGSGDPPNNAQQLNKFLGKILRIDVDSGSPYGIPTSNPFYSSSDPNIKKEIWAYGLRNPWRISFDRQTHDLYIADVGQSTREEVDVQPANSTGGENYGWHVMEGTLCYSPSSGCDQSGKILPVAEYDHSLGCAITGGYVYRGSKFPSLEGYYFYGDYCSGRFFSLRYDSTQGWISDQLLDTSYTISTFGEDERGELYLADYGAGKVYNIQYEEAPVVISSLLSDSNPTNATTVNFTVTFSQIVTGVDVNDFNLTTDGVSGANVSGVSGSGSTYTVAVNTGVGNGTIRLDVVDNDSIKDSFNSPLGGAGIGNGNFISGQSYNIDRTIFADVLSNNWAWPYIERLYNTGLTSGCSLNPLMYCPNARVSRSELAVFLLKGMHGASYMPPNATGTKFTDVSVNYWAAAWVEELASEGYTNGCGNNNYCPEDSLTRAQMAVFLLKAMHGSSFSPPVASPTFGDDAGHWAQNWIEELALEGITSGCGNGNYCPDSPVTRDQMAVFLVKAFNLP